MSSEGVVYTVGRAAWRLHVRDSASSTNDIARNLPPWNAVRARTQLSGRGRFGRSFVSDAGGLWLSAVLPTDGGIQSWAGFSLMVGCSLLRMMREMGLDNVRLRWPNDLMIDQRKLAGLLIEQASHERLVVGFGLNVTNEPWLTDSSLAGIATNMKTAGATILDIDDIATRSLDALADAHERMPAAGMAAAIRELNETWITPAPVKIHRHGATPITGRFCGLDPEGHLRLLDSEDREFLVEHQSVERLTEL